MIAEAASEESSGPIDFIRLIRNVADAKHVSVHDILSPPPRLTYRPDPDTGQLIERISFDPFAGWSWREVLVWGNDASRAAAEQRVASSQADWQRQGGIPNYDEFVEP
jgi:hypothetical protein